MDIPTECSVCNENYDEDAHVPRVLTCGHTFCSACLEGIIAGLKQCPFDRKPIEVETARDIPKNFVVLELAKRLPELLSALKENASRETKAPKTLKRVKKNLDSGTAEPKPPNEKETKAPRSYQRKKIVNTDAEPLLTIGLSTDLGNPLSNKTKGKGQKLEAIKQPITKEEEIRALEAQLLSSKVLNVNDCLKQSMSCLLEKNDSCPQVKVILTSPNEDVFQAVSDYYYDARINKNPEAFERAIIQDLIFAIRRQSKIIAVKAPTNAERALLVKTALLAFLSKEKLKNKIIYAKSFSNNIFQVHENCPFCSKQETTLPYNFVYGHTIPISYLNMNRKLFETSIKRAAIFPSKSSIDNSALAIVEIRNTFFFGDKKEHMYDDISCLDFYFKKKIECSSQKSYDILRNKTNVIDIEYDILLRGKEEFGSLLEHSFVLIESWTQFKHSLCDLFSFVLSIDELDHFINHFQYIENETAISEFITIECGDILQLVRKMRRIFAQLKSKNSSVDFVIEELIEIANSSRIKKPLSLNPQHVEKLNDESLATYKMVSNLSYFIRSLIELSYIGFKASDDFCMAIDPSEKAIFIRCLNPSIGLKKLIAQKPLAIITICNSHKEMTDMSNSCQISFDAIVSPTINDFESLKPHFLPNCKGFFIDSLYGIKDESHVTYTSRDIEQWADCHAKTLKFLLTYVQKILTTGGAVVYCPNIAMITNLITASKAETNDSDIYLYFAHQATTAKKKCKSHEEASKNSRSILFVPIKSKFCYEEKIQRHAAKLAFIIGVPLDSYESPAVIEAKRTMSNLDFNDFYYGLAVETIFRGLRGISVDEDDLTVCCFVDSRYSQIVSLNKELTKKMEIESATSHINGFLSDETERMNQICSRIKSYCDI